MQLNSSCTRTVQINKHDKIIYGNFRFVLYKSFTLKIDKSEIYNRIVPETKGKN